MRGDERDKPSIEAVRVGKSYQKPRQRKFKPVPQPQVCTRCGKSPPHKVVECPAKEAVCHRCGKKGHYQSQCRSKLGSGVKSIQSAADNTVFLDTISSETTTTNSKAVAWTANIVLNNRKLQFKVDTGADVTVISPQHYCRVRDGPLRPPQRMLTGAAQQHLDVRGKFKGSLRRNDTEVSQDVYVVMWAPQAATGLTCYRSLGNTNPGKTSFGKQCQCNVPRKKVLARTCTFLARHASFLH